MCRYLYPLRYPPYLNCANHTIVTTMGTSRPPYRVYPNSDGGSCILATDSPRLSSASPR